MARKTLEKLTFDYLRAAMEAEEASAAAEVLPVYQYRIAATLADQRMNDARDELAAALGSPVTDYILGIYRVTAAILGKEPLTDET